MKVITTGINYLNRYFIISMAILMAVSLHILANFNINETKIRVGLSDLLMPVFYIFTIYAIIKYIKKTSLIVNDFWFWIITMTLWIIVCLINGYNYSGELLEWAIVNKVIGWFILMSYLIFGIYIGVYSKNIKIIFIKTFIVFGWIICIYEIVLRFFNKFGYQPWFLPLQYRIQGFYENPNAFGICIATIVVLQIILQVKYRLFNVYIYLVGTVFCFMGILYSYSRSAWLGLIIGLISSIIIYKKTLRPIVGILILSIISNYIIFSYIDSKAFNLIVSSYKRAIDYSEHEKKIDNLIKNIGNIYIITTEMLDDISNVKFDINRKIMVSNGTHNKLGINITSGKITREISNSTTLSKGSAKKSTQQISIYNPDILVRLQGDEGKSNITRIGIIRRSIEYWKESPIIGIGLGSYMWRSKKENISPDAITIHNSAQWLLIETGIIGLLIFCILVFKTIMALIKNNYNGDNVSLDKSMVCIIFAFLGASIGTEVLYQRYFWILLGMSIVNLDYKNKVNI